MKLRKINGKNWNICFEDRGNFICFDMENRLKRVTEVNF